MTPRQAVEEGIAAKGMPGAAWAWGRAGKEPVLEWAGRHTYAPDSPLVGDRTLWDLASLTKVVATTGVAMALHQQGLLDLESHASAYLPRFQHSGVTLRQLLLHRSGLPAYASFQATCRTPEESEAALYRLKLRPADPPATEYSCMGFMVLQRVLESVGGASLDKLAARLVFGPLGMSDSQYNPSLEDRKRCAPTEAIADWRRKIEDERGYVRVNEEFIQGGVHDPAAFMMGGTSGNAGLFSPLKDLALWAAELAAGGDKAFKQDTVLLFTARQDASATRALGFDTKSPEGSSAGSRFGARSFGHTGYTGTCIWVDPDAKAYGVLLANRVHPDDKSTIMAGLRPRFFDAAAEELGLG